MNKYLLMSGIFVAQMTFAHADVIYKCSPKGDDGDQFGSTLVVGIEKRELHILSDYLTSATVSPVAGVYSSKQNVTNSGTLVLKPSASMMSFQDRASISLRDDEKDSEAVSYSCRRISQ